MCFHFRLCMGKGAGGHNRRATSAFSPCSSAAFSGRRRRKVPGLIFLFFRRPDWFETAFSTTTRVTSACHKYVVYVAPRGGGRDTGVFSACSGLSSWRLLSTVTGWWNCDDITEIAPPPPGAPGNEERGWQDAVRTLKFTGSVGILRKWRRSVPKLSTTDKMFNKLRSSRS